MAFAAAASDRCQPKPDRGGDGSADEARLAVRGANDRARCITSALIWHHAFDCAPPPATRTSRSSHVGSLDRTRKNVAHRHRHAFQHRPQKIVGVVPAREPFERAAHIGAPERRSLAGEIGQEQRPIARRAISCRRARLPPRAHRERARFDGTTTRNRRRPASARRSGSTCSPQISDTRPGTSRARDVINPATSDVPAMS